jgi:HPr kinase/phosphorylase
LHIRRQSSSLIASSPPQSLLDACAANNTPVIQSPKHCSAVIDQLRIYLSARLADTVNLHGVFMDVLGMGVLITGDSGVGKSELALELISRGHGLVADDVVEMARIAPTTIEGRCPGMLRDFLEVRGLGLLNIRTIFGETASRRKMKLKIIVHLHKTVPGVEAPRLPLDAQTQEVLGVPVRKIVIPVAAGRNLAVLLEAAVRNTILQLHGIDSMQDFMDRQQRMMLDDDA